MIRVAFSLIGGRTWTGGNNYLRNLLEALTRHRRDAVQPVIFLGTDIDAKDRAPFERIPGVEVVHSAVMNEARKTASLLRGLIAGRDTARRDLYRGERIGCVFESASFLGWRTGIPAIAWVPDLQHRELSHLFTRFGWWKRELGFRAQIAAGYTVMVSSEHTRMAFERIYRTSSGRVHAVRFAVPAPAPVDFAAARAVADAYGLPERFFFLPNQFWAHKNHRLVIEALAQLKRMGREDVVVAATGMPLDPRNPGHFGALQRSISESGVSAQMRILGLVPFEHLSMLMAAGQALLNPSLMEGWSTTVEEARAQGAPMILSDLPVHREQMGTEADYFDPHDAASLAAVLDRWQPLSTPERLARTQAAHRASESRVIAYADDFLRVLRVACEPASGTP
ncbi:glycosyltransferase involved in cell wall biosynthesis [Panacagrimonas perspica]|uniref:Glycosyltransferase involved in cell wall biosynthesis n=1 Tax=Panacagrimonas perspica TaxID=381431 RepID=A0A4R7NTV1_9GAMM|nr:glycosyltransferase family 1 protein [Panacagrimonas perspica]TDU24139.1 glycosyltransferase involved in cell wall biosynthesis [Panacagrimonas perspica]THD04555.1 hypothetical protein B1810_03805 [Panacagrimonas perspica]